MIWFFFWTKSFATFNFVLSIWRCATLNNWSSCIQGRFRVDSLAEANAALKNYGPESFHGDHISVKKKSDQQSAITKQNIHVSSISGKTFPKIMFSRDVFHRS